MKPLLVLLALLPALSPAQDEGGSKLAGTLKFANKDRVSGSPIAIDAEGNLVWEASAFFHEPVPIRISKILEMRLEGGPAPDSEASHQALLTLTNGDTIRGELTGLDGTHVTLRTWYGGLLKIRRSMASDLEIMRSERALYSGPTDFESWKLSDRNSWKMENGSLISTKAGGISREIDTPERCRIGFDLAWQNALRFRVLFFSSDGESQQPDNCYDLVCQNHFVYLRKRWMDGASGGSRIVGQSSIQELRQKEKLRFDFYIDRKSGTIALYIDGKQSHVWTDQDPGTGKFGNNLHFISEDFSPIRISQIRVTPWQGDLPENIDPDAEDQDLVDEEGQLIHLQNGDIVVGEVGEITDGILDIKTKHADMKIPVSRMRTVNLSTGEYEEPIRKKGDVRAWLKEGGRITFRLDSFTGDTVKGYSQTFGDAEFKVGAFSRFEFNIYNPEFDSLRGTNW